MKNVVQTPLMRQYYKVKSQYPDALILFRVGDFYETFEQDAVKASEVLGITLTKRANGSASFVDLAGFPYHALDNYLPKLIRAGLRVAICEQLEDPKMTNTIVKRGITEIITPGVTFSDNTLEQKKNNFLASVYFVGEVVGAAFIDVTTGDFFCVEASKDIVKNLINSYKPSEIIYDKPQKHSIDDIIDSGFYTYPAADWMFVFDNAYQRLLKQFETINLKGYGIDQQEVGIVAAGSVLSYIDQTQHTDLKHINSIQKIDVNNFLILDKFTTRNLEIFSPLYPEGKSLIDIIDKTKTPMGSRLLKRWLQFPLIDVDKISKRHDTIDFFIKNFEIKQEIEVYLSKIQDIERLISKITSKRINPRELIALKNNVLYIDKIYNILENKYLCEHLSQLKLSLTTLPDLSGFLEQHILDDPSVQVGTGNVIKAFVNAELDELRNISKSGHQFLSELRDKLARATGIQSLKISYNKVFGFYIEVTNAHKNRVPQDWIRKQTLVNAERYITIELKEYEEKILSANEKIEALEKQIYEQVLEKLKEYIDRLKKNSQIVAEIDCLIGFTTMALENNYCRAFVDESKQIEIKEGRHPVIEKLLPVGQPYIANDIFLDDKKQQILIITGPNMAGKSALLRQTALICILAQIGSFVPANEARIGYLDRIFTRVGATDNLSVGESTFMVEMTEAAYILNNLTQRSVVIFDELGRGTSTYDGISIAWSIVEYLHQQTEKRPKTLFATHYHELNEMEKIFERIKNFNVSVKEEQNQIVFLRKLQPGGSEHSFGIHVAKMAGVPKSVVKRAEDVLFQLENSNNSSNANISKPSTNKLSKTEGIQLKLFQLDDPVLENIRDILLKVDVNQLTPLEALNTLDKIKRVLEG